MLKWAGFSIIAEGYARITGSRDPGDAVDADGEPIPPEDARQGFGGFVQGGYLLPGLPFEVSARYSNVTPFGESSLRPLNELGVGLSYYIHKHTWKVQTDLFRRWRGALDEGSSVAWRLQLESGF